MKTTSLPPGTKVQIKVYKKRPGFWNRAGRMDEYMGRVLTIHKIEGSTYRMKECFHWSWRRKDFKVVSASKEPMEPNLAFSLAKRRRRR